MIFRSCADLRPYLTGRFPHRAALRVACASLLLLAACSSTLSTADPADSPIDSSIDTEAQSPEEAPPETIAEVENDLAADPEPADGRFPAFPTSPLGNVTADLDGALLGVSTGLTRAEREPRFDQLEGAAGRQLDIGHVFHPWNQAIPTEDDLFHLEQGRILMISWNGTDTIEIQNGVHDDWIRTQATSVRDLGQQVMLRWFWEMDANRRLPLVHSGEDYIGAWNHIRGIFDEVGATNAEFVWCPNEFLFWDGGDPTPWYPGDENVDWLCADGYNWQDSVDHPEWVSPTDIFEDFYAWAEPRGLPIVIGETGSNEALDDADGKADWLRSWPQLLADQMPEIDAVVYFDKDFLFQGHADWRVDTSGETFAGWNEIAQDPYFNPLAG